MRDPFNQISKCNNETTYISEAREYKNGHFHIIRVVKHGKDAEVAIMKNFDGVFKCLNELMDFFEKGER